MPSLHLPSLHITAPLWSTEDGFRTAIPGNVGSQPKHVLKPQRQQDACVTSQHHFYCCRESGHLRSPWVGDPPISEVREGG
jgi:hypothetical protein